MLSQRSNLRYLVLVPAMMALLFALACGGSDDNGGDSPTATTGSQGGSSPTATSQPSSSSNIAADTGIVTVGNTTYEFSMPDVFGFDVCLTAFGVVTGEGTATDGSDVELEFDIPPVGYETQRGFEDYAPPSIEVNDNVNDKQWIAGGDFSFLEQPFEPGESQIDSYTSEGGVATGSATFIDFRAYTFFTAGIGDVTVRPEPVTGTFEIHCGA